VFVELWQIRGGDKAPVPRRAEAPTRLMPDSHNACWEFPSLWRNGA
jgi:hypothetical protein